MAETKEFKRGAAILLVYGHDLFLLLRDDKPGLNAALQWAVLAGAIEPGENADQTIHREIMEEVGTQVSGLSCIGSTSANTWYIGSLDGQQAANMRQGEGCARGFFSYNALVGLAKVENKGGLGGAIRRFMINAPEEIRDFLARGTPPDVEMMNTPAPSAPK